MSGLEGLCLHSHLLQLSLVEIQLAHVATRAHALDQKTSRSVSLQLVGLQQVHDPGRVHQEAFER